MPETNADDGLALVCADAAPLGPDGGAVAPAVRPRRRLRAERRRPLPRRPLPPDARADQVPVEVSDADADGAPNPKNDGIFAVRATDPASVARIAFEPPFTARRVRVVPADWTGARPCLRLELYGCPAYTPPPGSPAADSRQNTSRSYSPPNVR